MRHRNLLQNSFCMWGKRVGKQLLNSGGFWNKPWECVTEIRFRHPEILTISGLNSSPISRLYKEKNVFLVHVTSWKVFQGKCEHCFQSCFSPFVPLLTTHLDFLWNWHSTCTPWIVKLTSIQFFKKLGKEMHFAESYCCIGGLFFPLLHKLSYTEQCCHFRSRLYCHAHCSTLFIPWRCWPLPL